jgi:isoleucyl-tRNA synthetase
MPETTENKNENRSVFPSQEEAVLAYWKENKIFQKTLDKNRSKKPFVFFEGPPTANGKPGLHHVEARAFKDLICRFKTMEGFLVDRKAGWDTHGLPVELEVEKQLGFTNKNDIEKYGVAAFNAKAKESVWKYLSDWQRLTERMGYFVDMEHPYITYELPYMESEWWILKNIYDKGLMYHGYKIGPYCPRCGTTLSSHELAQGYQTVHDPSIFVKFYLKDFSVNKAAKKTALLVWTTTPWTLPANLAVAIGENLEYNEWLLDGEILISLHDLPVKEGSNSKPKLVGKILGKELVGMYYQPLYPIEGIENNKVYTVLPGNFISEVDGTGLVHIAPSYGEDDFKLGQKYELPIIINLDGEGKFKDAPKDLPYILGKFFKDADIIILKDLKEKGLIYMGNLGGTIHEYPFCWRCHTPLIYRTNESWFIDMPHKKKELLANNQKINWIPATYKTGRFGGWLREVRDWNLSRRRYWGTPLPIWQCESCHNELAIGSLKEISDLNAEKANIYLVRHGEATNNTKHYYSNYPEKNIAQLTSKGKLEIQAVAKTLSKQKEKIDIIVSSDIERTKESANIIASILNVPVIFNANFREVDVGDLNGKPIDRREPSTIDADITKKIFPGIGSETYSDILKRMVQGLREIINKYPQKNILIISHEAPLMALLNSQHQGVKQVKNAQLIQLKWPHLPINDDGGFDLHRPYIDEIKLKCPKCGQSMQRVTDLIDVWFDSGSMPFAQWHYPFENKELIDKKKGFPADYICEAADQTRGWFYTLLAISTLLDKGPAYKNVVSVGFVLDNKGEKMSKTKGNIVDPWNLFKTYGADALRWYFFRVNAPDESKLFSEKDMLQYFRRFIMPLWNVYLFYAMYKPAKQANLSKKPTVAIANRLLDQWILIRMEVTSLKTKEFLDAYKINEASKELENFVDDLSRWYLRRSRTVFQKPASKKDLQNSAEVLAYVLEETAKIIAPFTPFVAESLWQKLGGQTINKSIHLCDWPKAHKLKAKEKNLLEQMAVIRDLASLGLQIRQTSGIKVRQPLGVLEVNSTIKKIIKSKELWEILKDELNIKEIKFVLHFTKTDGFKESNLNKLTANLDTTITAELYKEGLIKDLVRGLQDLRQKAGLKPGDLINLGLVTTNPDLKETINTNQAFIKEAVKAKVLSLESITNPSLTSEIEVGESIISTSLIKI